MDRLGFVSTIKGVGGLVFGNNSRSNQEDDGGVEQLLERISNGVLAEDRRAAMAELQEVVAENHSAQLAFGSMGFPVLISIIREERADIDLVRGALETLVSALNPIDNSGVSKSQLQPGLMNSELLSREPGFISLLLSLLEEEDFYVRYYTLQLLTSMVRNCSTRLQEAILATPQGITHLMDMMQDREVIRNEALLLLVHLTRAAEEIQKIVVFEGAFERIFNIIKEEGGSDGGIVVQDSLELLNNLLRHNISNQVLLRETLGFQNVTSLLKVRKGMAGNFPQQKAVNLLCALETIALLLAGSSDKLAASEANVTANQTILAQNKLLDFLLYLSVEARVSAAAVRSVALRCIGDLVLGHSGNQDLLRDKIIGEGPDADSAIKSILRLLLSTNNINDCAAAEYIFRCFCMGNPNGQITLASTMTPLPKGTSTSNNFAEEKHMSFGSVLIQALISKDGRPDLETCCRAVIVLTHILNDNIQCKEQALQTQLEIPESSLVSPELLMPRCVRYLAVSSQSSLQPVLLRLLVTWLADCPSAVSVFLATPAHLTYTTDLLLSDNVHVAGLAAVLLSECILYNTSKDTTKNDQSVVDLISQRLGLSVYFSKWEALKGHSLFLSAASASRLPKPMTRSSAAAVAAAGGSSSMSKLSEHDNNSVQPLQSSQTTVETSMDASLTSLYDKEFVKFIEKLEPIVKERILELFSQPKSSTIINLSAYDRSNAESEIDYINRLKSLLQNQGYEIQELLNRNTALVEELVSRGGEKATPEALERLSLGSRENSSSRAEIETLKQQLQEAYRTIEATRDQAAQSEAEAIMYKQLAAKHEVDLKSLSDAYNSLEQDNNRLDSEIKSLRRLVQGDLVVITPEQVEAAREEGRAEAQKESEAELNDLLMVLGQDGSKIERLKTRLLELGEDVDQLLKGIGEGEGKNDEEDDEEDDEEEDDD